MTITYLFLEDGLFLAGDSVTGRTAHAEPGSEWAERAREDPVEVAREMLLAPQNASPADPRGQSSSN